MELLINGDLVLNDPDKYTVSNALLNLSINEGGFAILEKGENEFIQTCGDTERGFELEYQDGSIEKHYRCKKRSLTLPEVTDVFILYLESADEWKDRYQWEWMDLSE